MSHADFRTAQKAYDMSNRLEVLVRIKLMLKEMMGRFSDVTMSHACTILHDVVVKLKAEDLTTEHRDVLVEALGLFAHGSMTKDQLQSMDLKLIRSGLNWLSWDED